MSTVTLTAGKTYKTGRPVQLIAGQSGVTISGTGTWLSTGSSGLLFGSSPDAFTAEPIDEADEGDTTVTTTAPSGLAVGDVVLIYTGQTNQNAFTNDDVGNPDSEVNIVTGVAGSTVSLQWPLAKNYRQEYYELEGGSQGDGFTATDGAGDAAPLAIRRINPVRDLTIENITIDHTGSGAALFGAKIGALDFVLRNVSATSVASFHASSAWTGVIEDCTVSLTGSSTSGPGGGYPYWVSTAYGSRDVTIANCDFTADQIGYLHIHEGSSDITVDTVTCVNAADQVGTSQAVVGLRGRGYNITLIDVDVTNGPTAAGGAGLRIDADVTGSATGYTFTGTADAAIVNNSGGAFTVA